MLMQRMITGNGVGHHVSDLRNPMHVNAEDDYWGWGSTSCEWSIMIMPVFCSLVVSAESGQSSDKKGGNKHMLMHWRITADGVVCHEIALFMRVVCGTGFMDWLEKRFMFEKSFEMWICSWQSLIILRWLCVVDRMLKSNYWLTPWRYLFIKCLFLIFFKYILHSHEYVFRLCIDAFSFLFA